jgi:glycosyltransferase involved in cell wall biosynthesis
VNNSISVVIPAYNEEHNIKEVVSQIRSLYPDYEVIVIDDGSSDETAKRARSAGATVYQHPYNIGNGAAVKTGIRNAQGDILVFMDADGQHNPIDIAKLIAHIPEFDMVVGARKSLQQANVFRHIGNTIYNLLATYVGKFTVRDLTSGFRAVKADVIRKFIYLLPNTYSYPTTSTLCILRCGFSLKYVSINVKKRQGGKSNIGIFKDGARFFMIIVKICTLFSPFRVFLPISCTIFLIGILYYLYTFIVFHRFTNMSALMFTTAIIVFLIGLVSEQICQIVYARSEEVSRTMG